MKKSTGTLLTSLVIVGFLVMSAYIYLSWFESRFFKQAVVIWIIVIIAVIGAFVFEIYDSSLEK
jgi:glucan phosphoethanolaminetransferase (alkaline phosphatase superfamily)